MRKGDDPGRVTQAVKEKAAEIQRQLPAGVEMRPFYSRDVLVRTTVTTVLRNLLEGADLSFFSCLFSFTISELLSSLR